MESLAPQAPKGASPGRPARNACQVAGKPSQCLRIVKGNHVSVGFLFLRPPPTLQGHRSPCGDACPLLNPARAFSLTRLERLWKSEGSGPGKALGSHAISLATPFSDVKGRDASAPTRPFLSPSAFGKVERAQREGREESEEGQERF